MTNFNRNQAQLEGFPAFRQQTSAYLHGQQTRVGGNNGPRAPLPIFVGQYIPSKSATDIIRLIPGSYKVNTLQAVEGALASDPIQKRFQLVEHELPFFPALEHKDGRTGKTMFCSAGPWGSVRDLREPCAACDVYWSERAAQGNEKKGNRIGFRKIYAFSIFDFGLFLNAPDTYKNAKIDERTGKPYLRWQKVNARDPRLQDAELKRAQGMNLHWGVGKTQLAALRAFERQSIALSCTSCHSQDSLELLGYTCGRCGKPVIDLSATVMTDQEIVKAVEEGMICPHCRHYVFPVDFVCCKNCERPAPATMFDVDLKVTRVVTKTDTGEDKSTLQIQGFRGPHDLDEAVRSLVKQKPLDQIYGPTPIEMQLKLMEITAAAWEGIRTGGKGTGTAVVPAQVGAPAPAARPRTALVLPPHPQEEAATEDEAAADAEYEDEG